MTETSARDEAQHPVAVPICLLDCAVAGLRAGAEATLDRDWERFTTGERIDAERFVQDTFHAPADALIALCQLDVKDTDQVG